MLDLGINSSSISYEVALEVLGQSRQPFMQAIHPTSARGSIHLGWLLAAWRQSRPNWLEG